MKSWRTTTGLVVVFVVVYLLPLGFRPLAAPDETRYAEIPREMLTTGDWIVPQLNGMDYFEKPVGGYWAVAVFMKVFGENAFATRLPSALGIALSAIALLLLLRFDPDEHAGPLAVVLLLTSLGVIIIGTTATLDGLFTGWLTISIVAVYWFLEGPPDRRNLTPLIIAGAAAGLAFLTKGFLALVVPALAIAPYLVIRRSVVRFFTWSWVPLLSMAAVALPWSLAVGLRSQFWTYFFWVGHVQRFLEPRVYQHGEPWWFYVPVIALACLPWTAAAPAALSGHRGIKDPDIKRLRLFAICWFVGPSVFFSFSSGKLMPYVLPCLPPVALLLAIGLVRCSAVGRRSWISLASVINVAVGTILVGTVVVFILRGHPYIDSPLDSPFVTGGLLAGCAGWLLAAGISFFQPDRRKMLFALALAPIVFTIPIQLTIRAPLIKTPAALIERHRDRIGANTIVVGDSSSVHSLCWLLQRTDILLFDHPGEFLYGLDNTSGREALDIEHLRTLVENSKQPVFALLNTRRWQFFKSRFGVPELEDHDDRFVLIQLTSRVSNKRLKQQMRQERRDRRLRDND